MSSRNAAAGLNCLFEAVIFVAYFGVALLLHSWMMAAAPFAIALVAVAWAFLQARLESTSGERRRLR
jgi:hypothetical protein